MSFTPKSWSARLALAVGLFDAFWAFVALTSQATPGASTVQMSNLVVWIFLHLPAALLGSLPFSAGSPDMPLPATELLLIGILGIAQMAFLGWLWGRSIDKDKP